MTRPVLTARGLVQDIGSMSRRERRGGLHPVDVHVGARVRAARLDAGLSLVRVAARVGVAFQQLQKYEAGTNRISASMLFDLAGVLRTSVGAFYDGLGQDEAGARPRNLQDGLRELLAEPEGTELLRALLALPAAARPHLVGLARELVHEARATMDRN